MWEYFTALIVMAGFFTVLTRIQMRQRQTMTKDLGQALVEQQRVMNEHLAKQTHALERIAHAIEQRNP